ncbi:hypothetical protein C2G38_2213451, partial [Gigaspora rosea]
VSRLLSHFFRRLWCESSGSSMFISAFMVWVFGFLGFFHVSLAFMVSPVAIGVQISRLLSRLFRRLWCGMFNEVGVAVIGVADAVGTVAKSAVSTLLEKAMLA